MRRSTTLNQTIAKHAPVFHNLGTTAEAILWVTSWHPWIDQSIARSIMHDNKVKSLFFHWFQIKLNPNLYCDIYVKWNPWISVEVVAIALLVVFCGRAWIMVMQRSKQMPTHFVQFFSFCLYRRWRNVRGGNEGQPSKQIGFIGTRFASL